jgi:hypothetical protein
MTELERAARTLIARQAAPPTMAFDEWLRCGIDNGFVGPPVCGTHDGMPTSTSEDDAFDDGHDPCLHILRLYLDAEHKVEIEAAHAPSVWRRTNAGF